MVTDTERLLVDLGKSQDRIQILEAALKEAMDRILAMRVQVEQARIEWQKAINIGWQWEQKAMRKREG